MSVDASVVVNMAIVALEQVAAPTEEQVRNVVDRLAAAFGIEPEQKEAVIRNVHARRLVHMDVGYAVAEQHTPWVDARRASIDSFYWDRYKQLLQRSWASGVITALDRSTDDLLDLMGDPENSATWKRRGLVMGDVQSGKTATYAALICKAADAGYKLIVLLTGTIESLRRQTQERLDHGFVGFDSSELLKQNWRSISVGVGNIDGSRKATVFTSSQSDFVASTVTSLGLGLKALSEPALVVIKKNTSILKNLHEWLRANNTAHGQNGIDEPMLLIDDEADNASLNTKNTDSDPTRVNDGIRKLLMLFRRTTYVGFTATPFANIFVNPDSQAEMLGDDLFPRDFIYTLQSPSNYFGPRRVFLEDPSSKLHIRSIEDAEDALPSRHSSSDVVSALPGSLFEALRAFLVTNAIRDLRGEKATHRSMLVNVSQYTRIQDQVESLLHEELVKYQTSVRNFAALTARRALEDSRIKALHETWQREYSEAGFSWEQVQQAMRTAVLPISTRAVNQRTGPTALDYRAHREHGLRVIAVGGNSLSRGLTLEGLTISYFRRTTQMYDTLLQMGRWFGYRPGYEDLCRVWLAPEALDWYGHVSEVTDELRAELRTMRRLGRTPKDFGLAVRKHPDSLLVTARNKMRTASEFTRIISLSQQSFESVELPCNSRALADNFDRAELFLQGVRQRGSAVEAEAGPPLFRGVPRQEVARLLRGFTVPDTEFRFQPGAIADLLDKLEGDVLADWDVAIPSGSAGEVEVGGMRVQGQARAMRLDEQAGILVVSGTKRRVGSRGVEKAGLTSEQIDEATRAAMVAAAEDAAAVGKAAPRDVNVADRFYRAVRTRPLLLIHILKANAIAPQDWTLPWSRNGFLVAIGLSFPVLENEPAAREVEYKINLVRKRQMFSSTWEADEDDDAPEDPT